MSSWSVIYLSQDGSKSETKTFNHPELQINHEDNDPTAEALRELPTEKQHDDSDQLTEEPEMKKTRYSLRIRKGKMPAITKETTTTNVDGSGGQSREARKVTKRKGSVSEPTAGTHKAAKMKDTIPTKGSGNTDVGNNNPKEMQWDSIVRTFEVAPCPSESTSYLNAEQSEVDDYSSKSEKRKRIQGSSEYTTDLNNVLIVKQLEDSTQLNEARKELIKGWKEYPDNLYAIGIKRMGELDPKPFRDACVSDEEALQLCSLWQSKLSDPLWHPFQVVQKDGKEPKEILIESDEQLKKLKAEYGVEVYDAVHRGLVEINEYNPSGMYPIQELWNFKENRRATLKEAISVVFKMKKD